MRRRQRWSWTFVASVVLSLVPPLHALAQSPRPIADRDHELFDLILRSTDDADLLSSRELAIRQKLLDAGVDPRSGENPTILTAYQRRIADAANWDLLQPPRQVEILELDTERDLAIVFKFPETSLFFSSVDTNLVGLAFEAPRDFSDSLLTVNVVSLDSWQKEWVSIGLQDQLRRQLATRAAASAKEKGLLNFTLPIDLPRTLERVIGKGEATSIRISGQLNFSIGGRTTKNDNFLGNELRQKQSLFPSLEMQQSLRVNMDGQVGEKIKVRVRHDSEQIGSKATEVKLAFEGDEDDIIRTIRAGNIDVTLPGSRLLGVGASKGGLFGIKVEGAVGPVGFTLLTSKEQSQSNEQNFSQSGGAEDEIYIDSTDYAKHRFFKLMVPSPVYFAGVAGAPHDESATRFLPDWKIDAASVVVYKAVGPGIGDENYFGAGIAYVDVSGIGWEDGPGGVDQLEESELLALGDKKVKRDRWRRLLPDTDWTPLQDADTQNVVGIALNSEARDQDILAVTYNIIDGSGNVVRRVGHSVDEPVDGEITIPEPGSSGPDRPQVLFLKLLKGEQEDPRKDDGTFTPTALTWEYELRNYYDLRGRDIEPDSFDIQIRRKGSTSDFPENNEEVGTTRNQPWFQIFGLDRLDKQGNPGIDGSPDVKDQTLFNLRAGLLQFPSPTPFAPSSADLSAWTNGEVTSLKVPKEGSADSTSLAAPELYKRYLYGTDLDNAAKFQIVAKQTSVTSRLRLNAFNIQEGSEEVTLNGQVLQKGVDYTIDYLSGEVNLIGRAAGSLNAQSSINVKYEVDPLLGGGRTSLSGMNLTYRINNQNQLSTTWLLQTQPNNATKPRLGEEPSKSWVGNLSGKFRVEPGWLRSAANLLPRVDSDQAVSVNLDGEVAVSVPNPNTKDVAYVEDFESVDQSTNVSMSREGWVWASLPAEYRNANPGRRAFGPQDRAYAGWHRAVNPGVNRRDLNPDLSEQEKRDTVPTLELRLVSDGNGTRWEPTDFAGFMRPLGGEVDLTQAQFLEFWLDDRTGNVAPETRKGILHFDFGFINEDWFWNKDSDGNWVLGHQDSEDQDGDGVLGVVDGKTEDTGMDGVLSADEGPNSELIPDRPGTGSDPAGDDFSSAPGDASQYLYINGTEGNQHLDDEDINLNGFHDLGDGYFTLSLDLSDTTHALVDVYRDYADDAGFVADSEAKGSAWRKYRLDLRDALTRATGTDGALPGAVVEQPYTIATPDLARVRTIRIWYEDPDGGDRERRIRFAEMRFLGNRWINDHIRTVDDQILPPGKLAGEEFRLGVLNNKDNPEYRPPVFPDTRNNIAEKEQSLQFLYTNLEPGHMTRARKDVPGRNGQDFTVYDELNFFWREPQSHNLPLNDQMGLEAYYWVGTDSLNYYEISFAFDDVQTDADGWQEVRVDLGELTNVKFEPFEPLSPGVTGSPLVQRGIVADTVTGEKYQVVVRGRPDLTQVHRFYAGVRYPLSSVSPDGTGGIPFTGEVLFNEIRLKGVNNKVGYAQRYAVSANIPGLADMQVEWSQTDAEFRGLNARKGSQVLQRQWSARTSSRLQNFLPTFGFDIPFRLNKRVQLGLPKFAPRTDIKLLDAAARDSLRTESVSEGFDFSIHKKEPSQNKILQLLVDPFQYSLSTSRSTRTSPTRDTHQESADTKVHYDLQFRQSRSLKIPFTHMQLRYLPTQITAASNWRWDIQEAVEKRSDGTIIPRDPQLTKTSINNMTVNLQPLRSIQGSLAFSSNRNLILGSRKLFGLDIGQEETYSQSLSLKYRPALRFLRWAKPDLDLKSGYSENRRPGIRQNAPDKTLPDAEDGYLGQSGQVRDLSSSQDLTVKGEFDLFGWLKNKLEKPTRRRPSEASQRRDAQRRAAQIGRTGRGRGATPPPPTTTPPDSSSVKPPEEGGEAEGGEEPPPPTEEQEGQEVENPFAEPDAESGTENPPDLSEPEGDEIAAAEEDSLGAEEEKFAPGEALANLVRPFKNLVLNLQPIRSSWSRNRNANYTRVNKRADAAFRFGITPKPKISADEELVVGRNNDGTYITEPFGNEERRYRTRYDFSTKSRLSNDISVDLSYSRQSSSREGSQGESSSYNWEVPVGLRIGRVEKWKIFGELFSSSSININYRRSKRIDSIRPNQEIFPNISWSLQPRWNFRFQNDLDANLNVTYSKDSKASSAATQLSRQLRANVKLQKNFDANGRLSFLRFGRQGTGTTIDMNVDISFTDQRSGRLPRGQTKTIQNQGNRSLSVKPKFSYQFNRNLRAGLQLEYTRSTNFARDNATTQTVGLFFDATLNF